MKKHKNHKKKHGNLKFITIMLAIITTAVWLILLLVKYIISGVNFSSLLDNIIGNILGILPPIILFDFLYEYLTREHVADEMTEQITKTLMSSPETIELFDDESKKVFVRTTVQTLVGDKECDMVYGVIEPYLEMQYNTRRFFRYNIILRDYEDNSMFSKARYMRIYEDIKYKKHYIGANKLPKNFRVGFFVNNEELDKELYGQTYLFRENLKIDLEELEILISMSPRDQFQFVSQKMALNVFIDGNKCAIQNVVIDQNGIQTVFASEHDEKSRELNIEIMFNMPRLKRYSEFLVSINEPTYSPMIQLSYPESTMNVTMFPFLNDGAECLVQNAMRNAGSCDIYLRDKWVYPMSGVVFIVEDNK